MARLLTLGIYSVLIAIVLVVGVANASDTVDIVPAKKSIAHTQYSNLNTFNGPRAVAATDFQSACTELGGRYFYHSGWNRYVCDVEGGYSSASEFSLKNCTTAFNASFCSYEYTCPPSDNLDYTLPTSNPDVANSEGKYCKKPEENKCKQQTLNNPLDDEGAFYLYYYKSTLSGCFDGCTMTFKSDPDAQAAADSGQSVMNGLIAQCYLGTGTCAGPLMQFDGTQCPGSDIQTAPEPTTSGAEPTTSGAEPTTSGAEPTTSGAEPTTSGAEPTTSGAEPTTSGGTGTDPNCYGTNQGDKCNGTSGGTGTGTGSGSGAGSGSGSGTGTSGGTGTGSDSGTGDDFGEKAAAYCKANPDSLVCAKLGSVEAEKIATDEISVSVTPDSGWGSASAQCPASPKIALDGYGEISINTQPLCDFLMMIRPVIIAVAWLMAAFIMIGWRTSSGED